MKVFILGLDGASFRFIDQWLDQLPNFKRCMERGVRGNLLSTNPPHTALAWPSILTGVHPGKHGIFQFWKTQTNDYEPEFFTSQDMMFKTIAQLWNEQGKKAGLLNIPMTHPPQPLDGFILSWPLVNTLHYSYPKGLVAELARNKCHYLHDLATMYSGQDDYMDQAIQYTSMRMDSIRYLMKHYDWDLMFAVFTEIDRVCHYYWKYMDKDHSQYEEDLIKQEAIFRIYQETDRVLGELIADLSDQDVLAIVSDHGFTRGEKSFYIHTFLQERGEFTVKKTEGFTDDVNEGNVTGQDWYLRHIDWEHTAAYMPAPGCYGINVNLAGRQLQGTIQPKDYESTRDRLINLLQGVTDQGQPIFKQVLRREDVYRGAAVDQAPDIILIPQSYELMVSHRTDQKEWFGPSEQNGLHEMEGIMIMTGGPFKYNHTVAAASVTDIMPSLLYAANLPIPEDIDGEILYDAFNEDYVFTTLAHYEGRSMLHKGSESSVYSHKEKQEIEEKLKSMGYI